MKKIIPFNNVLEFNTDIAKITAISLEHEIKKEEESICGEFFISGEYKITDGQVDNEKFNFELPFDIAFGCTCDINTLVVDIDDFRYQVVDRNKLEVNIDLSVLGDEVDNPIKIEESRENIENEEKVEDNQEDIKEENHEEEEENIQEEEMIIDRPNIDKLDGIDNDKEDTMEDKVNIDINNSNDNNNSNNNIFNGFNEEEKYVTYRVYRVSEGDTLDKIMEKYNISKEEMEKYNNISDIKVGDKLIIPAND